MIWLVLASASPRRKDIIQKLVKKLQEGLTGTPEIRLSSVPADVEEMNDKYADCAELVLENSSRKALWVYKNKEMLQIAGEEELFIIGSDTVISFNGEIVGKPKDMKDAISTLLRFSGKQHQVITGVVIVNRKGEKTNAFTETSNVQFRLLDNERISEYFGLVDPLDKAGSYAIQEHGDMIIEKHTGSLSNIIGLPAKRLYNELEILIKERKGPKRG